ncbi:MAG: phosphoribosyltransferase [Parachlamydiales bacterium]|nr:phosphoribosyltransferase [Parachlamydiales bacterium]
MLFKDRRDAGQRLAEALKSLKLDSAIAIGLPRGGVVVAAVVASLLHLPLDVIIPRKIGAPFNPEFAIGAIAGDEVLLNDEAISALGVDASYIQSEIKKEKKEAARRLALYRRHLPVQNFIGRTVIVIDDGIASGATMRASLSYLTKALAQRIIVAVPVAPPETIQRLRNEGFEVICLYSPESFQAVGQFYEEFAQTEDREVIQLLESMS